MIVTVGMIMAAMIVAAFLLWKSTRDTRIIKVKKDEVFSFKSSMELVGLPIITFYQNGKKYHFIYDTGGNCSYITVGSDIAYTPKENPETLLEAVIEGEIKPVDIVLATIECNGVSYTHEFNIVDYTMTFNELQNSTGIPITGLIGGDFMAKYNFCIDYCEYVIYTRK